MADLNYISKSDIFFSCTEKAYRSVESNLDVHALIHIYSGSLLVKDHNGTYVIQEGETALFYRNMLATFIKQPGSDLPFKSVAIGFSQQFLQSFYAGKTMVRKNKPIWELHRFKEHPLLKSLFDSILPYYDDQMIDLPLELISLKVNEALTIVHTIDPKADSILGNFTIPGKLDIVDFMQKNYAFNIPLERFAYLSGRSLATFKRDFQKAFNMSPQKWLLEMRLKQAHFLITEKHEKPSDVYLEVGFENYSHFSRSFKRKFGNAPSNVMVSY
jgi:AraC-like DNA-binding protein